MFSRIFNTAKSFLSTTSEAEREESAQVQPEDTEQMVATRRRGELPPLRETPTKKRGSPANAKVVQKRKTYEVPVAELAAEPENEAPEESPNAAKRRQVGKVEEEPVQAIIETPVEIGEDEVLSPAKRRKVAKANEKSVEVIVEPLVEIITKPEDKSPEQVPSSAKSNNAGEENNGPEKEHEKDLEIRTRSTIAVVLPAMDPIPPSELSNSEEGPKGNVDMDVAEPEIEETADEPTEELALEQDVEVAAQETSMLSSLEKLVTQKKNKDKPSSSNQRGRYAGHTGWSSDRITPSENLQLLHSGFLPAEFLEVDEKTSSRRTLDLLRPQSAAKRKRRNSTDLAEVPKERRIGNTTYKIAKTQKSNLAPKSKTTARSTKEAWLYGRNKLRLKQGNMRKPFSRGFFVEKK